MKTNNNNNITAHGLGIDPNFWVTPLGDMMTFLMIFFLILWAYTQFIQKKEVRKLPSPIHEKLQPLIQDLGNLAHVEVTEDKVAIQLPESVLFDSGSAVLKPTSRESLSIVAEMLKRSENPIVVEGHTDNIPIVGGKWKSNWQLSAGRAYAVVEYFLKRENIPPDRISARGYGPYRPIAPFDTPANRKKNRRVDINILTKSYEENK